MDQGPLDTKRPRLSTGSSWSAGGAHHGVSLLHPTPSPTSTQLPHHPPPPYQHQQPSHLYSLPAGPGDQHPHPPPPPPPPPPLQQQQQQQQHTPIDDRRHEPDMYPPMQEHRQPPHSPAHPPYQVYRSREPMVKPDPGDDTLPQLRRPHSTGNAPPEIMTPGGAHPGLPPQSYRDDKQHIVFDNGPQPPMYGQPSYPPQTPGPQTPYGYSSYGLSHTEPPYSIHVSTVRGKRKAPRASQACDMCRQHRTKCDEANPCGGCKERKVECKYREAVPKQQGKAAANILDDLAFLRNEFSTFGDRISRLERALKRAAPSIGVQPLTEPGPMQEDDDRPGSADSAASMADDAHSSSPGETQAPIGTLEARTVTQNMEEGTEAKPGPYVRPGAPAIPLNHTTLAALLLKWRSIEILVERYLGAENIEFVDEFPIRQEEGRGLLRVWGRGEGLDSGRIGEGAIHDLGMMEVSDDYSDAGAPSPADCWGGISGSPGPGDGKATLIGVQTLDFSEANVWKYVKSYQDNIQNMHPLIIPVELNAMVKLFLDGIQQSASKQSKSAGIAKFVRQVEAGAKRKRSPAPKSTRPTFQRSINNALVLLVLALGKICLVKDKKIPDVVPVSEPPHGSPLVRNGHPASPSQGFPPSYGSHSHSSDLPSPKDNSDRNASRRQSFQGAGGPAKTGTSIKRNLDVIPGLDYFAYATAILGGQLAGTSLRHIHAYVLAGLYHGQLGRVMESYAYIKQAGWALQVKMRPSLDRFKKLQESMPSNVNAVTEKSDNQLVIAFWTCLQLESDIIAELPLPQSHILEFQEIMPYPNVNLARDLGFDDNVLQSYLAQLYLRKTLNQIHQMLYNPDNPLPLEAPAGTPTNNIEYIQNLLDMQFVPPKFMFKHSDPPAQDILSARLRAKYWGAQVITYRPFIRQILEFSPLPTYSEFRSDVTVPANGADARTPGDIPQQVIEYAVKGIRALIESTRAFHNVEDKRFIITNVFGTAHAQWGNLLILAAAFKDPILSAHIDENTLKELFSRTIAFFKLIAHPTSALAIDMRILEGLERELCRD
ncbi:hypothetical protein QBC46DRAFT_347675 [Diplogelasinospora grovesii]|uniref:Zn(2)-C6 fungal-type domain-containing protein n=1 Tax=Diplogelasinospora grovesii TaxID=303347 RepID=A0AAN6RZC7_9PEZI|nr:hypothetical protein QBC46DRAFT_347675 [Diplogelasinospora grovesii]